VSVLAPERLEGLCTSAAPKLARMRASLAELGSALVAFSGGVDSTFVLQVSVEVLGDRAVALTAISASVAPEERREATRLGELLGVRHVVVDSAELLNPAYRQNGTDRCYFCKSELYALCERTRGELGLAAVVDGFNADDTRDHRPGHRAAQEARVHSPLADAGLTKDEIRALSHAAGLPTWDKPAMPCLASRIPYGTAVTEERLFQVGSAESELRALGLRTFRVRYHGEVARLEVSAEELPRFGDPAFRDRVNQALRRRGFAYVALDLEPFRSGRLNEAAGLRPGAVEGAS
jgi:uncharacterized protein